jgi:Tol biopolymer transport system component
MRPLAVVRGGCLGLALFLLAGCSADRSEGRASPTGDASFTGRPSPTFVPATEAPTGAASDPFIGEPIDVSSLTRRIVFSDEIDDIWVVNADGMGLRQLTTHPGPEFDPAWSPDGTRIAYRDSRGGINEDDEIYVMRADGTGRRNLTADPANDWGPAWSPDGTTIVFNSDRDGLPMGGFLVEPDGSNLRRIPGDVYIEYPEWSPDATRIAFMGYESLADHDIYAANVDGTG